MAKAAAPRDTTRLHAQDCPMSEKDIAQRFDACLADARAFSRDVLSFLQRRPHDAQARWAQASVEAGRVIFQPWSMEILFVLAVTREARFGELQTLLGGISSRTLSDKLQALRDEGLVDRHIYDEQPIRIAYRLTREGLQTAALATPLFAHLNHRERTREG